jgi:hypothetical protein
VLVTQKFLLDNKVRNLDDLRKVLPDLNLSGVSTANWIPTITF